uniref:hypothetical protein n=1 Tax=Alkalispirochaeta alkalica TaxID=46356 RepID=UPI00058FC253
TQDDELKYVFLLETPDRRAQSAVSPECQAVFVLDYELELTGGDRDGGEATLESSDGAYTQSVAFTGGQEEQESILLRFLDVEPGKTYRLRVDTSDGQALLFEGAPFMHLFGAATGANP